MDEENDKRSIDRGDETSGEGGAAAECNNQSATENRENRGEGEKRRRGRPRKEKELDPVVILNEIDPPKEVEIVLPNTSDEDGKQKKRKPKPRKEKSLEIEKIITTISNLVSMRPGFEIWKLSNDEVKQLSEPIENIIKKSDFMTKLGEHSDAIALTIACGTIFIPRAIMQIEINKTKKRGGLKDGGKNVKGHVPKDTGSGQKIHTQNNAIPNENDMRPNDGIHARHGEKYGNGICDVIYPIY